MALGAPTSAAATQQQQRLQCTATPAALRRLACTAMGFSTRSKRVRGIVCAVGRGNEGQPVPRQVVARAAPAAAAAQPPPLDLAAVLARVRAAVRGQRPLELSSSSNAMAFGEGEHMGCKVGWTFIWRPDGAFYEEVRGRHLTYKWGFDGGADSHCWEVDPCGIAKELERDDHEASLLGALLKSGGWLVPQLAAARLEMELEGFGNGGGADGGAGAAGAAGAGGLARQYQPHINMPPVATTIAAAAVHGGVGSGGGGGGVVAAVAESAEQASSSCSSSGGSYTLPSVGQEQQQQWRQDAAATFGSSSSSSSSSRDGGGGGGGALVVAAAAPAAAADRRSGGGGGVAVGTAADSHHHSHQQHQLQPQQQQQQRLLPDAVYVAIKLRGGRMLARVRVDTATWQPLGYSQPLCSDSELWRYEGWTNWAAPGRQSEEQLSAYGAPAAPPDSPDVFYPRRVSHILLPGASHEYETHGAIARRSAEVCRAYAAPPSPPVPIDAQYLDNAAPRVPVWQTQQGHLLVEAHLDGRRAGWMILDTGASGFVIEPAVADLFNLPAFGALRIAGVAGKVRTRFRRASQLRVGPLLLSDPVLMEMRVGRLVTGFHDRVVGIAGFDVFRRCRLTLPCAATRRGLVRASSFDGRVRAHTPVPVGAGGAAGGDDDDAATAMATAAFGGHPWPPTAATTRALANLQAVQQSLQAAADGTGLHAAPLPAAAAAAAAATTTMLAPPPSASAAVGTSLPPLVLGIKRRAPASSSSGGGGGSSDSSSSSSSNSNSSSSSNSGESSIFAGASSGNGNGPQRRRRGRLAPASVVTGAPPGHASSSSSGSSSSSSAVADSGRSSSGGSSGSATAASASAPPPPLPFGGPAAAAAAATPSAAPAAAAAAEAAAVPTLVVPPVAYAPNAVPYGNLLVEVLLQKPGVRAAAQLEDGYVWQRMVMIASLPHVELEFVAPTTGRRHASLFLVDTGAGGTEVMFHSRAAKELGLLTSAAGGGAGGGGGGGRKGSSASGSAQGSAAGEAHRYVSGVGDAATTTGAGGGGGKGRGGGKGGGDDDGAPQVAVQAGRLPEVVIRGQAGGAVGEEGALLLRDVRALFSRAGGLDISLYSAGMVCADLLARMQVVLDYPNRRIGWKAPPGCRPPPPPPSSSL